MKKVAAILLTAIYLFNLVGFTLLCDHLISQADQQMVRTLDNGYYGDAALIEIKIPMQLPYGPNRLEYERWDGEIELNGVHYNYVKRRIYNDTLFLVCIPNMHKTQINNAKTAYAGSINDTNLPSTGKKAADPAVKKMAVENEYDQPGTAYTFNIHLTAKILNRVPVPAIITRTSEFLGQPPDSCC